MVEKTIFLDLDGVILDTEQRVLDLRKKQSALSWDDFFDIIDWKRLLFEANEINDSIKILKKLESRKRNISILTKIHTLSEAQAKVYELRENRGITSPIIFVPPHVRKSEVIIPDGNILIDDSLKNVSDWSKNGGDGILFVDSEMLAKKIDDSITKVNSLKFLK